MDRNEREDTDGFGRKGGIWMRFAEERRGGRYREEEEDSG